jgi:hypothetical protein
MTYPDYVASEPMSAVDFGRCVADWDIGEPIDLSTQEAWRDAKGTYWWGDVGEISGGTDG